ncbi:MAG: molybdopterin molybdotransferase MoeA [Saprospiraceae bacterium]|nr:molybdopterin molybdotransferase MoeA [Saprospiraceae bacterium]MDW8483409.1 molybdopterin molybdotransferase MoeA [Saprospiraceae bacterium]
MVTVQQADELLAVYTPVWEVEEVPLERAVGRVLRQAVHADRDFPPFARVSMDGIAIAYAAWEAGQRVFAVLGQIPAGAAPQPLVSRDACWEVATGGVLPPGADTVIPYEQISIAEGKATILAQEVRQGQNVHPQGKDRRAGDVILESGVVLGASHMALLATVGLTRVRVTRQPSVAILATGDELVQVNDLPQPWQIRLSNPWAIEAMLRPWVASCVRFHCSDEAAALRTTLSYLLSEYEVVFITGGVSAGKRDIVPEVLREIGATVIFHKVSQRPGKPFLFARTSQLGAVFAMPGNPVSAFLCTVRYALPWIYRASGATLSLPAQWALLAEPLIFKPDLTWFVPVSVENRQGHLWAHPRPGHGSGDLANLTSTQAFLELPRGQDHFEAGEAFPLWFYP